MYIPFINDEELHVCNLDNIVVKISFTYNKSKPQRTSQKTKITALK